MEEYEDAARNLGQGIRHLRELIEAARERLDGAYDSGRLNESSENDGWSDYS